MRKNLRKRRFTDDEDCEFKNENVKSRKYSQKRQFNEDEDRIVKNRRWTVRHRTYGGVQNSNSTSMMENTENNVSTPRSSNPDDDTQHHEEEFSTTCEPVIEELNPGCATVIDQDEEDTLLYTSACSTITKKKSKSIIMDFICKTNLNDVQKNNFYEVLKAHLPRDVDIESSWLPKNNPVKISSTSSDEYTIFDVASQYAKIIEKLNLKKNYPLVLNIDGGQRYKTNTDSFWPMLAHLHADNESLHRQFTSQENIMVSILSFTLVWWCFCDRYGHIQPVY